MNIDDALLVRLTIISRLAVMILDNLRGVEDPFGSTAAHARFLAEGASDMRSLDEQMRPLRYLRLTVANKDAGRKDLLKNPGTIYLARSCSATLPFQS